MTQQQHRLYLQMSHEDSSTLYCLGVQRDYDIQPLPIELGLTRRCFGEPDTNSVKCVLPLQKENEKRGLQSASNQHVTEMRNFQLRRTWTGSENDGH